MARLGRMRCSLASGTSITIAHVRGILLVDGSACWRCSGKCVRNPRSASRAESRLEVARLGRGEEALDELYMQPSAATTGHAPHFATTATPDA